MASLTSAAAEDSSKARRRKSLKHAMMLVDSAIANLEVAAVDPAGGGGGPSVRYRRRRSSIMSAGGAKFNPLLAGVVDAAVAAAASDSASAAAPPAASPTAHEVFGAQRVLRDLARRCGEAPGGEGRVSLAEVAALKAALAESLAAQSREGIVFGGSSGSTSSGGDSSKHHAGFATAADLPAALPPAHHAALNLRGWDFDVFEVGRAHPEETMAVVGMAILEDSGLVAELGLARHSCAAFLRGLQRMYHAANPYHNHLHGIDVAQTCHYLLHVAGLGRGASYAMSGVERLALVVAALAHDAGHFALNNAYLCNTHDPLALAYHYTSPLERMHAAKALTLLATPATNAISALSDPDTKLFRNLLVQCILATDMANHGTDLAALKALTGRLESEGGALGGAPCLAGDTNRESRTLLLKVALHSADVSNPAKPWAYYMQWTDRVLEEFFAQGDLERAAGLPIGMGFDKTKVKNEVDKANGQLGFINFVVAPLYAALGALPALDLAKSAAAELAANTATWRSIASGETQGASRHADL